ESADDLVRDYYPAMTDVPKGAGPRADRYTTSDDRDITFRQLTNHTSGYLKPEQPPGSTFDYQTFSMNVLGHAIATVYGYYDHKIPLSEQSSGFGDLLSVKVRDPIGAS